MCQWFNIQSSLTSRGPPFLSYRSRWKGGPRLGGWQQELFHLFSLDHQPAPLHNSSFLMHHVVLLDRLGDSASARLSGVLQICYSTESKKVTGYRLHLRRSMQTPARYMCRLIKSTHWLLPISNYGLCPRRRRFRFSGSPKLAHSQNVGSGRKFPPDLLPNLR